jgi:hypothetical protein
MNRLGRPEYHRIFTAACAIVGVLAIVSVVWFLRAHYFNATNAGWGDQDQDRHQWLLGWGIRISALVALSCIAVVATISRRALISITTGLAVSGLAVVLAPRFPITGKICGFPGFFGLFIHIWSALQRRV